MKVRYVMVLVLAVAMVAAVACFKATGGGWFYDDATGNKITFGFTAMPTDGQGAKGQFQLVDQGIKPKTRIHGVFTGTFVDDVPGMSQFFGECRINGEDGHPLFLEVTDGDQNGIGVGDTIFISITGNIMQADYSGTLEGGNIKIHTK